MQPTYEYARDQNERVFILACEAIKELPPEEQKHYDQALAYCYETIDKILKLLPRAPKPQPKAELNDIEIHDTSFGTKLRELRKKSKMSQEDLSGRVHRSREWLADIERGKHLPPLEMLRKICNVFQLSMEEEIEIVRLHTSLMLSRNGFNPSQGKNGQHIEENGFKHS